MRDSSPAYSAHRTPSAPAASALGLAARLASAALENPCAAAQAALRLAQQLGRIAVGGTPYPASTDPRFSDPRWHRSGLPQRALQAWQATNDSVQTWLEQAPLTAQERQGLAFIATQISDALAPSNTPLHPLFADRLKHHGLRHIGQGLSRWCDDLLHNHGLPRHVPRDAYRVGQNLANSSGSVVFRQPSYELIHYHAQHPQQHAIPLLIVPPQLNRFYIFDLAEQRSLVRYALEAGINVFMLSWRNPNAEHRHWDLNHYSRALNEAIEVVLAISQSSQVNLLGACLGGLTCALSQLQLQQQGQLQKVRSCSYLVTPLDWRSNHPALLLLNAHWRERARAHSQRQGVLEGAQLARLFAWLRAKDLIWRYWTHNYLLNNPAESFDVLHWNADNTRLPAALHGQVLDLLAHDSAPPSLPTDEQGQPLNLALLEIDSFAVAGLSDHITPWHNAYRSMQLLGGQCEFVLANGGHIQAIVPAPHAAHLQYWHAPLSSAEPAQWQSHATAVTGSWWAHWRQWLQQRSGDYQQSPAQPGNQQYPALMPAPGSYVLQP